MRKKEREETKVKEMWERERTGGKEFTEEGKGEIEGEEIKDREGKRGRREDNVRISGNQKEEKRKFIMLF